MIPSSEQIEILSRVLKLAKEQGVQIFVVGGAIRDLLLGQRSVDFDLVIEGDAISFANNLHSILGGDLKQFPNFLTAKLTNLLNGTFELDFAGAREESYPEGGALPEVKPSTLQKDLKRRDFSINSLAIGLEAFLSWLDSKDLTLLRSKIIDPFNGLDDLDNRVVRILHPQSFTDDPTRIFRGYRYLARINGTFEEQTRELIFRALSIGALQTISKNRIKNELELILLEPKWLIAIEAIIKDGVLEKIGLPENSNSDELLLRVKTHKDLFSSKELCIPIFFAVLTKTISAKERMELCMEWSVSKKKIDKALTLLGSAE